MEVALTNGKLLDQPQRPTQLVRGFCANEYPRKLQDDSRAIPRVAFEENLLSILGLVATLRSWAQSPPLCFFVAGIGTGLFLPNFTMRIILSFPGGVQIDFGATMRDEDRRKLLVAIQKDYARGAIPCTLIDGAKRQDGFGVLTYQIDDAGTFRGRFTIDGEHFETTFSGK
jgi:hypothetical protein